MEEFLLRSQQLWARYGSHYALTVSMSMATVTGIQMHGDYRFGYDVARHVLAVSEAHGQEGPAATARSSLAHFSRHWFESLESCVSEFQQICAPARRKPRRSPMRAP
jgi:hypothetical protein